MENFRQVTGKLKQGDNKMEWLNYAPELEQLLIRSSKQYGEELADSLLAFGIKLYKQGYKERAIGLWRKGVEVTQSGIFWYNQGVALQELERYPEAEEAYRQAIAKDPNDAVAYYNLGVLLRKLERYSEAEEAYRQAIAKDPNYATAYTNLGNLLSDKKLERYAEAEEAYRQAIAKDPNYAAAYNNLGSLLSDKKLERYAEAEEAYRQAIAYNNLGVLLKKLERYAEAEEAYRQAIAKDPNDAAAYYNLGILLRVTDKAGEAIPLYEKIIDINPEDFDSYLGISSVRKMLGHPVEKSLIEKARQFIAKDDFYNKACLESICDNYDLAFDYLKQAAQKARFNPLWAWEDPDLQWIRGDPRFVQIVGPKPIKFDTSEI
jgi:tetratricopeptide (TPR) repeat protein